MLARQKQTCQFRAPPSLASITDPVTPSRRETTRPSPPVPDTETEAWIDHPHRATVISATRAYLPITVTACRTVPCPSAAVAPCTVAPPGTVARPPSHRLPHFSARASNSFIGKDATADATRPVRRGRPTPASDAIGWDLPAAVDHPPEHGQIKTMASRTLGDTVPRPHGRAMPPPAACSRVPAPRVQALIIARNHSGHIGSDVGPAGLCFPFRSPLCSFLLRCSSKQLTSAASWRPARAFHCPGSSVLHRHFIFRFHRLILLCERLKVKRRFSFPIAFGLIRSNHEATLGAKLYIDVVVNQPNRRACTVPYKKGD